MEYGSFLDDGLLGNSRGNILDGQMGGYQCHAECLVHENHKGFFAVSHAGFNVLGVSGKME